MAWGCSINMENKINIEKEISKINELYSKGHLDIEKTQMEAIRILFNENKKLKEKAKNTMKLIGANYIHKDKIKAMLEGITKEYYSILSKDKYSLIEKNLATSQYNAMRKILEELLEGE